MLKFNIHSNCFEDLQSIVNHLKREQKTALRGKNGALPNIYVFKFSAYIECTANQQKYIAVLYPSVKWEPISETCKNCKVGGTKESCYPCFFGNENL